MTIHELLAMTGLTESDEIPVWDAEASGEPTKKITAQNFAAAIKTLASLLGTGDVVNDLTSGEPMPPSAGCVYNALHSAGTWTAKFYAASTRLSATIASATYMRIGDVVFANIRGTFTSQANGGIYMLIDSNSGIPVIPVTCALVGTFLVDTSFGTLFHSNGTNHSAYFRLFDGTNQQGASVSGKGFEVSFFYTAA